SRAFDYIEIDSSFYNIPNIITVNNWAKRTPQSFKFTAKFPRIITHDKRLKDADKELDQFFRCNWPPSREDIGPSNPTSAFYADLRRTSESQGVSPRVRFRYAVEVRHPSWFQDLAYNFFANNGICLVWSQLAELKTPPVVTTDFVY